MSDYVMSCGEVPLSLSFFLFFFFVLTVVEGTNFYTFVCVCVFVPLGRERVRSTK